MTLAEEYAQACAAAQSAHAAKQAALTAWHAALDQARAAEIALNHCTDELRVAQAHVDDLGDRVDAALRIGRMKER